MAGGSALRRTAAAAPPRIVHLGLGAFARSHQAWYTDVAGHGEWGITGFTGRSPVAAEALAAQDGLYHVLVRGLEGDQAQQVSSLVAAHPGSDTERFAAAVADPATAAVTVTVTEAGYCLGPDGLPDRAAAALWDDVARVRNGHNGAGVTPACVTVPGRLLAALDVRHRVGSGPLALVPCDNITGNGAMLRRLLGELAERVSTPLQSWIDENVAFVGTSVDRITPATTDADRATVAALTGTLDQAPVVAEPFSDWVLCGDFPAGRPPWESAGAKVVDDLEPFERRKLWLLNGAHSLLAYRGLLAGLSTVAEAMHEPALRAVLDTFWDEAERAVGGFGSVDLDLAAYRADLVKRFTNARIEHRLRQISAEGSAKVRLRVVPVALAERRAGRDAAASLGTVAAWIGYVRGADDVVDGNLRRVRQAADGPLSRAVPQLIGLLSAELAADGQVLDTVREQVAEITSVPYTR